MPSTVIHVPGLTAMAMISADIDEAVRFDHIVFTHDLITKIVHNISWTEKELSLFVNTDTFENCEPGSFAKINPLSLPLLILRFTSRPGRKWL